MQIQCVKLLTGHDLLVKEIEDVEGFKRLYKPAIMQLIPTDKGAQMTLNPWPNFLSDDIEYIDIREEHILCITKVDESVADGYNQFLSPLELPSQGLLLSK
jgi:hypothetical protein